MRDKKTFTVAFPHISDLDITVIESGKGLTRHVKSMYNQANITKTIKCSNPDCFKGGLHIALIIWDMVSTQSTSFEEIAKCDGLEGTPLSKRKRKPCVNNFHFKIKIKYTHHKFEEAF